MNAKAAQTSWPLWVGFAAAALVVHVIHWVLLPFVLAAILGLVADPPIQAMQRRLRWPRWLVASLVFGVVFGSVGTLAYATGRSTLHGLSQLSSIGIAPLRAALTRLIGPAGLELFGARLTPDGLVAGLQQQAGNLLSVAVVGKLGGVALGAFAGLVLFSLVSFYLMVSGPGLARGALWLVPPSRRGGVVSLLPQMIAITRRYFVGVLAVVGFTAAAAWAGYGLVFHVRGALLLSLAVGLLETTPVIGPIIAAVLVTVAALQLHSLIGGALMIAYGMALRLAVDDLVAPLVLGHSVSLHPVAIMLVYVLGAVLFGVVGLLLAVPAAACLRIGLRAAYGDRPAPGDDPGPS